VGLTISPHENSQNPVNRKGMTQKLAVASLKKKFVSAMQFNSVPVFILCYQIKLVYIIKDL
jgi:hypothetical protein